MICALSKPKAHPKKSIPGNLAIPHKVIRVKHAGSEGRGAGRNLWTTIEDAAHHGARHPFLLSKVSVRGWFRVRTMMIGSAASEHFPYTTRPVAKEKRKTSE